MIIEYWAEHFLQLIPSYSQSEGPASPKAKHRLMTSAANKLGVNNPPAGSSGGDKRNNQNKPNFNRNLNNAIMTNASSQKSVTTTGTCSQKMNPEVS